MNKRQMQSSSHSSNRSSRRCSSSRLGLMRIGTIPSRLLGLSTEGYFMLAKKVVALAEEYCDGKIVFVLEGGYDPVNVANGVEATFDALTNSKRGK